jgi:hypothetical protein
VFRPTGEAGLTQQRLDVPRPGPVRAGRMPLPRLPAPRRQSPSQPHPRDGVGAARAAVFLLIPEIGAAPVVGLTVAGQQLTSMRVDRYGLLRLPWRPISRARVAGVASLLAGVALITLG